MKKLLVLMAAASIMAACSDSATAPAPKKSASPRALYDLECRSGYVIAYDDAGNTYCAPE